MPMTTTRRRLIDTDRIEKLFSELDGKELIWGWTDQSQDYPDGTSIHLVVLANHFGTNTIPPRPILSLSFDRHIKGLEALSDALNEALIASNSSDIDPLLIAMGQRAASEFKRDFGNIGPLRQLAESTIARKGHGNIWIESGHAKKQVGFQVREAFL